MNEDCFAFEEAKGRSTCKALKSIQCGTNACRFYKTVEEQKASVEKANARLRGLDVMLRQAIKEKYKVRIYES